MKRWLTAGLLGCCTVAFCQDSTLPAQKRMATVEIFAFGGIGYAGQQSEGEKDFHAIMALQPSMAIHVFEALYNFGNPQAKSYALAGFHQLDLRRFAELRSGLRDSKIEVKTMSGCIMERETLKQIADGLEAGSFKPWAK